MIDVEETPAGIRAVDGAKNEIDVELAGWVPGGDPADIDRNVDVVVSGRTSEVHMLGRSAVIQSGKTQRLRTVTSGQRAQLDRDDHLLQADDVITVFVRAKAPIDVDVNDQASRLSVRFPERTQVTIGLRSHVTSPTDVVTVPRTPEGVAAAITAAGASHRTDSPDRSYPSMREYPPLVDLDDDAALDAIGVTEGDGSIRFRLPSSLERLFVAAPLAYYLGATVEIGGPMPGAIETPEAIHRFSADTPFHEQVAGMLARVFYLDCLVRTDGESGVTPVEFALLDELPIDPETIAHRSMTGRFAEYLDLPFERIVDRLPRWPLAMSVDPVIEHVPVLPHLLDKMALILPAHGQPIDDQSVIQRSLSDSYRSPAGGRRAFRTSLSERLEPKESPGVIHGWLADGVPVDAFKAHPAAFSNRLNYTGLGSPRRVAVILNDDEMEGEFVEVANCYRSRAADFSIDVDVYDRLTTDELASVFQGGYDLVHYIGHCDPNGLRCRDGNLSAASLDHTDAQLFFLNACGSYEQGLELIERGSVGGAVTVGAVLDDQAKRVGTTFARLIGTGQSLSSSVYLSRGRSIMAHQYAIVGDGLAGFSQGTTSITGTLLVNRVSKNTFKLRYYLSSPNLHGSILLDLEDPGPYLTGNDTSHFTTKDELLNELCTTDNPVIFDSQFYWPEDLIDQLQ